MDDQISILATCKNGKIKDRNDPCRLNGGMQTQKSAVHKVSTSMSMTTRPGFDAGAPERFERG
jgi:hypothetical protein